MSEGSYRMVNQEIRKQEIRDCKSNVYCSCWWVGECAAREAERWTEHVNKYLGVEQSDQED